MGEIPREALYPTDSELQRVFRETLQEFGDVSIDAVGATDASLEESPLWLRAVLPETMDVRSGDHVRAGVAMRTTGAECLIHPYTLREVCRNGAVRAHAVSTRIVQRIRLDDEVVSANAYSVDAALADVASALRECASPSAFTEGVEEMRAALTVEADLVIDRLQLLSVLEALGSSAVAAGVRRVLSRQLRQLTQAGGRERSAFAFGNALTAAGRDAPSPALRWVLEEYGAAVFGASVVQAPPPAATLHGRVMGSTTEKSGGAP